MATNPTVNSIQEWRLDILRRDLVRHARSIEKLAARLEKVRDYPTTTAGKFCGVIRNTVGLIASKLESSPDDKLYHVHLLLCHLSEFLELPDSSRIEKTPWSLVQAIESFLKEQVGSNCSFIFRPQWTYNYGIALDFYSHYCRLIGSLGDWITVEEWKKAVNPPTIEHRVFCISFPMVERFNVLLHVNFGHEVGHILAERWANEKFETLWANVEPTLRPRIEAIVNAEKIPDELGRKATAALYSKEIMEYALFGLKELISDRVGIHLFGPAALAALVEFSAKYEPLDTNPSASNRYPPWRYRIRKACAAVGNDIDPTISHDQTVLPFVAFLNRAQQMTENQDDITEIDSVFLTQEAYKIIEQNWDTIVNDVIAYLPAESRQPYRITSQASVLNQLVVRLENNLPPNEWGSWPALSPVSLADIWNAGWAYLQAKLAADEAWDVPENYDNLCRLILKAMEVTFVCNEYGPKIAPST